MQKEKRMTSCGTLVTLTHPKSQFSHQKTCLPRYWSLHRQQAVDHPSCVVATGCLWGFGHLTGRFCGILMWKTIDYRYFITCKSIYSLYYCLISCNHDLDHWTIGRKLIAGPKQMHLHAVSAIHIVYVISCCISFAAYARGQHHEKGM